MKFKASFSAPLFCLILYALFFSLNFFQNQLFVAGGNDYLLVIILQLLILILPAIIFCRLKGVGYSAKLNIKLFSPSKLGAVISSSLALIFGSIVIRFIQIYYFNMSGFSYSPFQKYIGTDTEYNFLFAAMAFAVIPAITEEFIFRSIILTEYNEGGYGATNAVILSSFLCSFMFFSSQAFAIRLLYSVVFALLTYATGSSVCALISHLIFGIYSIFGERYILRALSDPSNKIISIFTFTMLFLIMTFITFGEFEHCLRQTGKVGTPSPSYLLKKTSDGKTPDISSTEKNSTRSSAALSNKAKMTIEALFSPTFLISILIYLISLFGFI